jgi:hypothetical protein
MSILELIVAGSMDCLLAAMLWLMVERRCPFLVVAEPSDAGKSTTMEALLAFRPASEVIVPIRGMYENFAFLRSSDAGKTSLVCAEIGYGMPFYIWGPKAVRVFECLKLGYSLAATLHADSAEEATSILRDYVEVPPEAIARLGFIVSLGVRWKGRRSIERWVSAVDVITAPSAESPLEVPIYRHRTPDGPAINMLGDANVVEALAQKAGVPIADFVREAIQREAYLADLIAAGVRDYAAVREKVIAFADTSR